MQPLITRCERRYNPASQRRDVSIAQRGETQLSRQASETIQPDRDPPPFTPLQDALFFAGSLISSLALFGTCYVLASVMTSGVSA